MSNDSAPGAGAPTHFTLRLLRLPTRATLGAAHNRRSSGTDASFRAITIIGVHVDHDLSQVVGWGECAALNTAGYTPEWAEGAFDLLRSGRSFDCRQAPMATAGIEMALLDADLKSAGQSLAERLGTAGKSAPAGAVVGLAPIPSVLDQVESLVEAGYDRVKLKIAPGRITEPVRAVRAAFGELELHVDANASLSPEDLPEVARLGDLGVRLVEQPFAVDDDPTAARLIAESDLVVAADEAVRCADDVDRLASAGAATAVVVKPSKLGGLTPALQVIERIKANGMQAAIGGMLETSLGRHVLAAMAPLPAFTLVGDLSPAGRWLADDPFRDLPLRQGTVPASARPGIAGEPMLNRLDRYTVRSALVTADAGVAALEASDATDAQPS